MRKLFVILIFIVSGFMTVNAQNLKDGATCPVTKAMVNYEGVENINISFIPGVYLSFWIITASLKIY